MEDNKLAFIIMVTIISLLLFGTCTVLFGDRDTNSYSNMECYEMYQYYQKELKEHKDDSIKSCKIRYILDNGFYKTGRIIHMRNNINDILEENRY